MAFHYRLEHQDGTSADPLTLLSAVPTWGPGDVIPLALVRIARRGAGRSHLDGLVFFLVLDGLERVLYLDRCDASSLVREGVIQEPHQQQRRCRHRRDGCHNRRLEKEAPRPAG